MKALSVRQPWATLIDCGDKTIEVRSWPTAHRGPLLICAAKRRDPDAPDLPIGVALCVVDLVECRPMRRSDARRSWCGWSKDHFAWVLANVRPLRVRFPVTGKLGLFDVPDRFINANK